MIVAIARGVTMVMSIALDVIVIVPVARAVIMAVGLRKLLVGSEDDGNGAGLGGLGSIAAADQQRRDGQEDTDQEHVSGSTQGGWVCEMHDDRNSIILSA